MLTRLKFLIYCVFVSCLMTVYSCAPLEVDTYYPKEDYPEPEKTGVYHKVQKGQTLWRIAKTYDVAIDDIISVNNIPNVAKMEENQLVFIPGAYALKEIVLETQENDSDFDWPVKGKVVSYYRQQNNGKVNKGIDIEVNKGEVVRASRSGKVVFADYLSGYGNTIIIKHPGGYYTVYSRNAPMLVQLGEKVFKNMAIFRADKSSRLAYLHFEIRKNSLENNPLYFLP